MFVGLLVSVFDSYCGVVLLRKYLSVVVMLLKWVGELSVRFVYFLRLCSFVYGGLLVGMLGVVVL